jgi:hypothetical protein
MSNEKKPPYIGSFSGEGDEKDLPMYLGKHENKIEGGDEKPETATALISKWEFKKCNFSLPVGTLLINEAAVFDECTIHYYPVEKTAAEKQKFTDDFFPESKATRAIKLKFIFAWYDLWVGCFWDRQKRWLYIFPVPMFGVIIKFK